MATEFKWFRSTVTGKVGKYPARFASRPSFEPVDADEALCLDCFLSCPSADEDEMIDTALFDEGENSVETEDEEI